MKDGSTALKTGAGTRGALRDKLTRTVAKKEKKGVILSRKNLVCVCVFICFCDFVLFWVGVLYVFILMDFVCFFFFFLPSEGSSADIDFIPAEQCLALHE